MFSQDMDLPKKEGSFSVFQGCINLVQWRKTGLDQAQEIAPGSGEQTRISQQNALCDICDDETKGCPVKQNDGHVRVLLEEVSPINDLAFAHCKVAILFYPRAEMFHLGIRKHQEFVLTSNLIAVIDVFEIAVTLKPFVILKFSDDCAPPNCRTAAEPIDVGILQDGWDGRFVA